MSVRCMSRVWEESEQKGSKLLLLLAVADFADDNGFAWPSIETLAAKTRMSERHTARLLKELAAAGDLYIHSRAGEGRSNQYVVLTQLEYEAFKYVLTVKLRLSDDEAVAVIHRTWGNREKGRGDKLSGVTQPCQGGDDIVVSGGYDIAVSDEPSLPIKEPPDSGETDIEQSNAESTAEFEDTFGSQPERPTLEVGTWQERQMKCPWLMWGDGAVRARNGVSAENLQHVGWRLEKTTGLVPVDGEWSGWLKGLRMIYQAGEGDWLRIDQGIKDAWNREKRYRPSHPRGFVGPVKKARRPSHATQDELAQRMENDPQFQAFDN